MSWCPQQQGSPPPLGQVTKPPSDQLSICRLRKYQGPVAGPSQTLGPEGLDLGLFTPSLSQMELAPAVSPTLPSLHLLLCLPHPRPGSLPCLCFYQVAPGRMVPSHIILSSRPPLGRSGSGCDAHSSGPHQTESSGRSCAIIIFRFPGFSPQSWTQGPGRSPRADTDISMGHSFIPQILEWWPSISPSSVIL